MSLNKGGGIAVASQQDNASAADDEHIHELTTLRRKLRKLRSTDKQYCEKQENKLIIQKTLIEAVELENSQLQRALSLQLSQKEKRIKHMTDVLCKQDNWKEKIAQVEDQIGNYETEIKSIQNDTEKQKRSMGGLLMADAKRRDIKKHIMRVQKRLENHSTNFNSTLATNTQLRDVISHLQHERKTFYEIYKKAQKVLEATKEQTSQVISHATNSYEVREESRSKMIALKEKAKKDLTHYTQQIKEYQRRIDHDQRLQDFMKVKEEERFGDFEAQLTQKKQELEIKEKGFVLNTYEEAFEKIRDITQLEDINEIVEKFVEVEDQNFALFNYVSELNAEIDQVNDEISKITLNIDNFESEGAELETSRLKLAEEMKKELSVIEEERESLHKKNEASNRLLEQLMKGIGALFTKIGCNSSVITDLLGGQQGVSDNNLLQHMGQVEQRTDELLELKSYIAAKDSEDKEAAISLLVPMSGITTRFNVATEVIPPAVGDDSLEGSDIEITDAKPLTHDELRNRVTGLLASRKESQSVKSAGRTPKSIHDKKRISQTYQ